MAHCFVTSSWHFFIYATHLDSPNWGRPEPPSASGRASRAASEASSEWAPAWGLQLASWAQDSMDFPPLLRKRAGSHVPFLSKLSP